MTIFPLSTGRVAGKITLPTMEDMRAMLSDPKTARLALVCATVVALATLGGIFYLAATGRAVEAVGGVLLGLAGLIFREVRATRKHVQNGAKPSDAKAAPDAH